MYSVTIDLQLDLILNGLLLVMTQMTERQKSGNAL